MEGIVDIVSDYLPSAHAVMFIYGHHLRDGRIRAYSIACAMFHSSLSYSQPNPSVHIIPERLFHI
jgi:hypothetical protein